MVCLQHILLVYVNAEITTRNMLQALCCLRLCHCLFISTLTNKSAACCRLFGLSLEKEESSKQRATLQSCSKDVAAPIAQLLRIGSQMQEVRGSNLRLGWLRVSPNKDLLTQTWAWECRPLKLRLCLSQTH